MTTKIDEQMMNKPYIRHVIEELEKLGYTNTDAISALERFFDIIKRDMGFNPNAWEFAYEVDRLNKLVHKKYDPNDPNLIDVTELRKRVLAKLEIEDKLGWGMERDERIIEITLKVIKMLSDGKTKDEISIYSGFSLERINKIQREVEFDRN